MPHDNEPDDRSTPIHNVVYVGRIEAGDWAGRRWAGIYIIHDDGTRGWWITWNYGVTWTPREQLPNELG